MGGDEWQLGTSRRRCYLTYDQRSVKNDGRGRRWKTITVQSPQRDLSWVARIEPDSSVVGSLGCLSVGKLCRPHNGAKFKKWASLFEVLCTVSAVEHCYFVMWSVGGCIFAKCTARSNLPKKRKATWVHERGMHETRVFAFWISSEQEFVGFMGVNDRKKREHRPRR